MDTWIWGPFVIQQSMLFVMAAVAVGYGIGRLRLKGTAMGEAFGSISLNAVVIWVMIWKLSVMLFDPRSVLTNPMSLLYYNGGDQGVWLAMLLSGLYVWYAVRKEQISGALYIDSMLVSIFGGYMVYGAMLFFAGEENRLTWGLSSLMGAGFTAVWMVKKPSTSLRPILQQVTIFVIGYALIWTVAVNIGDKYETGAAQAENTAVGLKIGQQAPDFELKMLDGQSVKLSDYRGKIVIINFWATWCPPCRAEMPHMQQYYMENEKEGVVILGVNATSTEISVPVVDSWLKEWGITFPIVLDEHGEVIKTYRVNSYPSTFVIDADGVIRHKHPGPMNMQMLKAAKEKADTGK
ncbi:MULTISPECIES: TlpA disulfide reductase family protein [unclassified Paenibacillus]|uniref:peroxiredoxin family protein n=1 Tax=unclassified Paenibacillus TaxID=185978 RepID=UPI001AE9E5B0|nr:MULTISPECIES: TlpA disulfide reductase family protein [unclassified Paenibacillus]MBP1157568.1 peroxiredoxin [Paenibacillus sp. PvP091]MBP1171695.1 peroxiredoxin [Paenibacillus sp. PvR098]MBP2438076.1 peroxiredoxin [Paenibacillus sp. PvP052]